MTTVSEDELLNLVSEFVAHETANPPGNEQSLADCLGNRLESSPVDFAVERQEVHPGRPNVVARAGTQRRGVSSSRVIWMLSLLLRSAGQVIRLRSSGRAIG